MLKRALVIDDKSEWREKLVEAFKWEGLDVTSYANGRDILQDGSLENVAIIIMDANDPDRFKDLSAGIRQTGYKGPIILVTGFPRECFRYPLLEGNGVVYIEKYKSDFSDMFRMALNHCL